ncbi:MAG: ATP synthase F1 subunit delta [Pseudomonadota bacterium]
MRAQTAIARRYAKALFETALEADALQEVDLDLIHLHELIEGSPDLRHFLYSKVVSTDSLEKIVAELCNKLSCHKVTKGFLGLLAQKRRLEHLAGVFVRYPQLLALQRKEMTAQAITAVEMNQDQQNKLKQVLEARTGFQVAVINEIDPEILGGMVLRLGGFEADSSLKTQLHNLRLSLQEVR